MAREIPLTQGRVAIVDDADYDFLMHWEWHYSVTAEYAARNQFAGNGKRCTVLMHRVIMGVPDGVLVDHINANKLDNRRCNLRNCTQQQNLRYRPKQRGGVSKYKGVTFHSDKRSNPWRARISTDEGRINLGDFATEEGAARAWDDAARKYHGQFAWLNFPEGGEQPEDHANRIVARLAPYVSTAWQSAAPIPATPAAAVCAKPVALGGGSPEQSGPYHVSNDDVVAWLFYAHPRRGWVHHGPWSRTYKRDKIRAIAARLNAMRWTDEVAL